MNEAKINEAEKKFIKTWPCLMCIVRCMCTEACDQEDIFFKNLTTVERNLYYNQDFLNKILKQQTL